MAAPASDARAETHTSASADAPRRIAVVGNYLPRRCGIATFTTDLCEAMAAEFPEATVFAVPVNDATADYDYPPRVRFEIAEAELASYRGAADYLNVSGTDLVCLQHEFGIFGGPSGSHVLALLRDLRMPLVTTLHTVLRDPDPVQRRVLQEVADRSDRLIVMSETAAEFLRAVHGVTTNRIDVIPHGIPDVPFVDPNFYKDKFEVEGKSVLLTFGLLGPNKGIEHVIEALPEIVRHRPDVVYVVLGATHPNVKRSDGESYRLSLERLARVRGVERHVAFYNRFVSLDELIEFIGAADVYLTPYLSEAQIVSGTLAYAAGAGKAVVSTPYWYARELLSGERGVLVPFADSKAIASAVCELLDDEARRHAMRKRAYMLGREMTWRAVAARYMESFAAARHQRQEHPRPTGRIRALGERSGELPPLDLQHLRRMTDGTGLIQHASFLVPDYSEGYSTDDNARGLLVAVRLEQAGEAPELARELGSRYLAFLRFAFNPENGRFRNFLSFDRRWLEDSGSDDSHGRSLWALGAVVGRSAHPGLRGAAAQLFDRALPALAETTSPRAWAFGLLGIHDYLRRFRGGSAALAARRALGERLSGALAEHRASDWIWFEDVLSYCNAVLPHGLLVAGTGAGCAKMRDAALASLAWLAEIQRAPDGHFVPIGSNGFYTRGGTRARFDQQPVEAQAMVSASLEALRATDDRSWCREAVCAFDWFLGRNDLGVSLFDAASGACRDGLHADRANENRGAESTLAFLQALLEMRLAENVIDASETPPAGE
ncbi:MAG TPA: glycosyltransferase family 4 protein [Myxococcota bacterium]|nr:glycosyltransferase family 4 protein [Myxococcota bacterium]